MKLAWGAKVSPRFREIVVRRAPEIGADPSHLMAVMAFETGRTFDPAKRNPASSATGLIQFMASTARELGTTTEALAAMSAEEQLDWVFRYFRRYAGRLGTLGDVYAAVLWPVAIGKPDAYVLFDSKSHADAYLANRGIDVNKDGKVTKAEITALVARMLEEGMRPENVFEVVSAPVEERSLQARAEDVQRIIAAATPQPTKEASMPAVLMVLQSLFTIFTPYLTGKLNKTLDKAVDDPVIAKDMTAQLMDLLRQIAGVPAAATPAPGTAPAPRTEAEQLVEAAQLVATIKADQQKTAEAEARLTAWADSWGPMLDRLTAAEQAAWTAEEASRKAAAERNANDSWRSPTMVVAIAMLGLPYIAVTRVLFGDGFSEQLQTVVVTAAVTGILGYIGGYYFGTTRNSAAKDAVLGELAATRPQQTIVIPDRRV